MGDGRLAFLLALLGGVSCGGVSAIQTTPDAESSATTISATTGIVTGPSAVPDDPISPAFSRPCILGRLAKVPDASDVGDGAAPAVDNESDASADAPGVEGPDTGLAIPVSSGPLTVLVIMDKSGSMAEPWDARSKWQVANEAFSKAIEDILDNLTIGAILFPQPDGCGVAPLSSGQQFDFQPGKAFADRWQATAESRSPAGSTPLGRAFQEADLHIEKACNDGLLDGHFRVIILTDGQPTCGEDPELFTRLPKEWRLLGIQTLVFGLPGSQNAADLLDSIAGSGGSSHYKSPDTPGALDQGFYNAVR